jgi:hypothetical protein
MLASIELFQVNVRTADTRASERFGHKSLPCLQVCIHVLGCHPRQQPSLCETHLTFLYEQFAFQPNAGWWQSYVQSAMVCMRVPFAPINACRLIHHAQELHACILSMFMVLDNSIPYSKSTLSVHSASGPTWLTLFTLQGAIWCDISLAVTWLSFPMMPTTITAPV